MAQEINTPPADFWCRTRSKTAKVTYKWTINDFSLHCQKSPGKSIQSSIFSSGENDKFKWRLRILPSGDVIANKDWVIIFVQCITQNISQVTAQFKLDFVDINNLRKDSLGLSKKTIVDVSWPFCGDIHKNSLLKQAAVLLPDDKLTIFCEIVVLDDTFEISGESEPVEDNMLISRINDDYSLLFETRSLGDVTLTVCGKDIEAHKIVLAARSPVFLAMFEHNMEELKTNCVMINDIDHEVFMEMLRFIYTDKVRNLDKMAADLLAAADKYSLDRLKAMCTVALYESLNIKNAVHILVISHLHNANRLKYIAIKFILDRKNHIMKTATFESMAKSYPGLMIEILCATSTK